MNKRANLLKHVKGGSGWRYHPVVWQQNGRLRPNYVLVNGKAERHPEGFYSIEWYENGSRRRQAVGQEASAAQAALDRHLHRLRGLALGMEIHQESKEPKKRFLAAACDEFLDGYRPSSGKKAKTYHAYRMALEYFQEFCPKRYIEQIDRHDLQRFTAFLMGKKAHDPRTAYNKLAVVAQFLKANNIPKLLKKGDWPSYVEREPEVYEQEELEGLFAACGLRNRVVFEFFLMTGMRDAEVRHMCWNDLSPRQFARVKAKPEWRFTPKNWEEREVPIPNRLMESLRDYSSAIGTGSRLLFPAQSGQPDRHFLRTLKRIAWTAGLNCGSCKTAKGQCRQGPYCEHWFLHKFRATYATMQLQGNVDLRTLQALLGHKDLASTMRYLKPARDERVLQNDFANRLIQASDSLSGNITLAYDDFDRLTNEATPQGSISYTYDPDGRRTSVTVAGQPPIAYTYDNIDRLTQVLQASAAVTLNYDNADRLTTISLPTAVSAAYSYDGASQLTNVIYTRSGTTIGDMAYEYDENGRRVGMGGSFARVNLPSAVSNITYDTANELLQWAGTAFTYDANGNLISGGGNVYAWDARNQLTSISGTVSAQFQYDAFRRRITYGSKQFTYSGSNVIQELDGGSLSSLLIGHGYDETFSRSDVNGRRDLLTDGLGSTVALADSTGNLQTQYTYEPFGKTTVSGTPDANSFQFTGREHDATDLYYYRARYYDSSTNRFISEDPIRFAGSSNFYVYAQNNPVMYKDPTGLKLLVCSRGGFENVSSPAGVGNHAFFYNTTDGKSCGRGKGNHPSGPDNPSRPGTFCREVPGSDQNEQRAMRCCERRSGSWEGSWWTFVPWANDCQNLLDRCLKEAGLPNPGVPGGRVQCRGNCPPPVPPSRQERFSRSGGSL